MSKLLAVLISAAIVASSLTSTAQAGPGRHLGFFLGGMAAAAMIGHAAEERRREEAYERERERRQLIAARERAAAARRERARQLALQNELALKKQKAAEIAAAESAQQSTPSTDTDKPALKKGDRLPSAQDAPATTADSTTQTTTTTAEPVAATESQLCREYSAAADGLIEVPCQ